MTPAPQRYNVVQLMNQEQSFYAKQTAMLNKLFERTGQREEWRNDFLGALENFISEQEAELNAAMEDDRSEESNRSIGERVFVGLNSLVRA